MGLPNVFQTGVSGMQASRAAIATAGHNISNANTEGYSRQRVETETQTPRQGPGAKNFIGQGTMIGKISRVNDEYVEKQLRDAGRDVAYAEDKDVILRQTEDVFNEMNGDGLNRLVARFFNEFRKLANEPENQAVRESVREASQAMVNDFHRLRGEVEDVRRHVDAKLEGYTREINGLAHDLRDLNIRIRAADIGSGGSPNDLLDKRDVIVKKLASYMALQIHPDNNGNVIIDVKGVGPLVVGGHTEEFLVEPSPADGDGKVDGAFDLKTTGSARGIVTHEVKGGKVGALVEVRDKTLSAVAGRLDEMALTITQAVNDIHMQGFSRDGEQGVAFFKPMELQPRAAEFIELSDAIKENVNHIATAAIPEAPGDNRIAIAISGLQHARFLNGGRSTMDEWYNSIVSDVGVASAKNRSDMNQSHDIITQLGKMRDQTSGVSIDEETANLMQFQHTFDASAKVIQVADEMLKTVLELKR